MARGFFLADACFFLIKIKFHLVFIHKQLNFFLYEDFIVSSFSRQISKTISKVRPDGDMSSMNTE